LGVDYNDLHDDPFGDDIEGGHKAPPPTDTCPVPPPPPPPPPAPERG